jgi:hypothetical protein
MWEGDSCSTQDAQRRDQGCPPLVGERRMVASQRLTLGLQLAHDERGLFLAGGIQRKLCWQWARSGHRTFSCHAQLAA